MKITKTQLKQIIKEELSKTEAKITLPVSRLADRPGGDVQSAEATGDLVYKYISAAISKVEVMLYSAEHFKSPPSLEKLNGDLTEISRNLNRAKKILNSQTDYSTSN
jgi:hypothetical protein